MRVLLFFLLERPIVFPFLKIKLNRGKKNANEENCGARKGFGFIYIYIYRLEIGDQSHLRKTQ